MPTEFERDTHYFMSTDLSTDIEAEAETDAYEFNCKFHKNAAQVKVCAQAFYVIQAHHDYCPHDTLTRYEEELFHEWESQHGQSAPWAAPKLGPRPSWAPHACSGRAWRPWAARHSRRTRPAHWASNHCFECSS